MPDVPALMVPLHLDALVLEQERAVVDAMADFTRLPYFDGTRDVNSDTGYLSEAIVADPFANQDQRLPAGVHLHWALPDTLTRAAGTVEGLEFPRVPDRWLVVRSRAGAAQPYEQAWVVESDYMHPPGARAPGGSLAYPMDQAAGGGDAGGETVPFRYLGRVVRLESWTGAGPSTQYLGALTAVGYGEPTFAAFYPNCRNVFGLHDADYTATQQGLRYDVLGWYADTDRDYLRTLLRSATGDPAAAVGRIARWAVGVPPGGTVPDRMLCYGRVTFAASGQSSSSPPSGSPVSVAVANSGPQALCAYLADAIAPAGPPAQQGQPQEQGQVQEQVEQQLEAVLLAPQLEQGGLDLMVRFTEAVHEAGFVAVPAGTLWTLSQQPSGQPADALQAGRRTAMSADLPAELAPALERLEHALNALNGAQQDYDRATDQIASLADQLFADWYRYVLCAYPPAGTGEDYPDIDQVRRFIERRVLADLRDRIAAAGVLLLRRDAAGTPVPVAVDDSPASRAAAAAQAAAQVQSVLQEINTTPTVADAGLAYRVQPVDAARYWQPTEPVVLLAGEVMAPTLRHGQDGRLRDDGLLQCHVLAAAPWPSATAVQGPDLAAALVSAIDALAPPSGQEQIGYQTWTAQDWHALLMSWQVETLPTAAPQRAPGAGYPPDYLTGTYTLADDEPELRLRNGQGLLSRTTTVYRGTSILTPYAQQLQVRRLAGYVMGIYQQDHQLPPLSADEAVAHLADPAALDTVRRWQAAKAAAAGDAPDPVAVALAALVRLQSVPSLSQSIGGFTEALLSRRQTLQLDVADPLGFDDYRSFTDTVHAYVQGQAPAGVPAAALPAGGLPPYLRGHNRSAPQQGGTFQPIRSGAVRLLRVRLLDAFGRVLDLSWDRVITSRMLPATAAGELISLPPRLVQPARLGLRWLSADLGEQQLTELSTHTPICGWVLPNHLEDSLAFYTADGASLGSIDRTGRWQVAPGTAAITPDQVGDEHLRRLISYLLGRGANFLANLHGAIDSALTGIDPQNLTRAQDAALLLGRPLAVVRAVLSLELQGLAALDQSWTALRRDLHATSRQTTGFTGVQVPVRLGDYRRLDDGLVGYWKETADGYEDTFYAPLSEPVDDPAIATHAAGELTLLQSVDAAPQLLTLLVDPRGAVHATCGVLPVKTIDIPAEQYADALGRIQVTVTAGPILSDPRTVEVPLPAAQEHAWSWVERTATGWRSTATWPVVERQEFVDGLTLALWQRLTDRAVGWLRPTADPQPATQVVPAPERAAALPDGWTPELAAAVQQVLDQTLTAHPDGGAVVTLVDFRAAAAPIAASAWAELSRPEVGWLTPLDSPDPTDAGNRARLTVGEAGAASQLPAPLTGTEQLVRSVLDLAQRRIVPPTPQPRSSGPRQLREGWLTLRGLEDTRR